SMVRWARRPPLTARRRCHASDGSRGLHQVRTGRRTGKVRRMIAMQLQFSRRRVLASAGTATLAVGIAGLAASCGVGSGGAPATTAKSLSGTVQFWTNANYPFDKDV